MTTTVWLQTRLTLLNRKNQLLFFVIFPLLVALAGCREKRRPDPNATVYIHQNGNHYSIMRNGKPFVMKGAGGYAHFRTLRETGGNTLRTWDTTHLAQILDSARLNNVAVIVGLPIPNSGDIAFYDSPEIAQDRLAAFRSLVRRYKDHPAVLMWCLGNELDFPHKWTYANFYKAFNQLTDMIHKEDRNHPVTTTILNFNPKYIFNIMLRCDIDLLSFNIFSTIPSLRRNLEELSWFWDGPYMLLEWGINGPWQGTEQTAWGAHIEDTSNKKAEMYARRYRRSMPVDDPRFLGACVFFWGQKQETTHTWFSMFDEAGRSSQSVSTMQEIWTGKPSRATYPQIQFMLLNQLGARDNVLLTPGQQASADVHLNKGSQPVRSVRWQIFREDWYRENQLNSTKRLEPLATIDQPGDNLHLLFDSPKEEGPYRIFATVYDGAGHFASCNTPFYVVNKP